MSSFLLQHCAGIPILARKFKELWFGLLRHASVQVPEAPVVQVRMWYDALCLFIVYPSLGLARSVRVGCCGTSLSLSLSISLRTAAGASEGGWSNLLLPLGQAPGGEQVAPCPVGSAPRA